MRCAILELNGAVVAVVEVDPSGGSGYQCLFWYPDVDDVICFFVNHLEGPGLH